MKRFPIVLICLLLLAFLGCADPAKDKPQAAVDEPAPEPVAAAQEETQRYVLGEGSSIGFVGSKVTGSHEGGFHDFEGEVLVTGDDPTRSTVNITIDATSLWADNERLTGHLQSPDFFEVETYPTATFKSTAIAAVGDGYTMTGNLTLHGVTKSIAFPAAITIEEGQVTAQAEFAIKRFEFGLEYPGKVDDLIRDDVVIKLDVVALPANA
jgi:polyisoprenoid-binding protein YceI